MSDGYFFTLVLFAFRFGIDNRLWWLKAVLKAEVVG